MVNVINMSGGAAEDSVDTTAACWLCNTLVSVRALFCHHCGTIQAVRELDNFTRLGLTPRMDLDQELLDKQYNTLRQTLDPQRFRTRGMGERMHAAKQLAAVEVAYACLHDVVSRSRYWLDLHAQQSITSPPTHCPIIEALALEVTEVHNSAECDRLANRAGQEIGQSLLDLLRAMRKQDWEQATVILTRIDGLEDIKQTLRDRRAEWNASVAPHERTPLAAVADENRE